MVSVACMRPSRSTAKSAVNGVMVTGSDIVVLVAGTTDSTSGCQQSDRREQQWDQPGDPAADRGIHGSLRRQHHHRHRTGDENLLSTLR